MIAFMQPTSKIVAVVVPLSNRQEITPDEKISFRHLVHFLGKYDKFLVVPQSLKVDYPGFGIKRFPNKFFGSSVAHTQLMMSPKFYESFKEYKYILLYHLDALVFSDQLMEWCDRDLDYIGAPFLKCPDSPWVEVPRVGNGGFSLRKIESFLRVINSPRYSVDPAKYWEDFCASKAKYIQYLNLPKKYLKRLHMFNSARWVMSKWHLEEQCHDDLFWSNQAVKYYPEFKVASVELGLRFAFEVAPRVCFEHNNYTLPFGCHAWPRYDRDFWEPYLLTYSRV
jgi:Protein of unknown function (DUF5672)